EDEAAVGGMCLRSLDLDDRLTVVLPQRVGCGAGRVHDVRDRKQRRGGYQDDDDRTGDHQRDRSTVHERSGVLPRGGTGSSSTYVGTTDPLRTAVHELLLLPDRHLLLEPVDVEPARLEGLLPVCRGRSP